MLAAAAWWAVAYVHVYVDPPEALAFSTQWRPQIVAGNVVSASGVQMYARGRIALEDAACAGAVVQYSPRGHQCMYVLRRDITLSLSCILWHPASSSMLQDMRALRQWHDARFTDELYGDALADATERCAWDLTAYDA